MLKAAVMYDEGTLKKWEADCINKLMEQQGTEVVLALVGPENPSGGHQQSPSFQKLEHEMRQRSKSLQPGEQRWLKADARCIQYTYEIEQGRMTAAFSEKDWQDIHKLRLDVILKFDTGFLPDPLLSIPKQGVWRFVFGEAGEYGDSIFGFWDLYHDRSTSSAELVRMNPGGDTETVLQQGRFATKFTYAEKVDHVLMQIAGWPAWACRVISEGNGEYLARRERKTASRNDARTPTHGIDRAPSWSHTLRYSYSLFWRKCKQKLQRDVTTYWNVGVVNMSAEQILKNSGPLDVHWLPRRPDFVADPFLVEHNGQLTAVIEERHGKVLKNGVVGALEQGAERKLEWEGIPMFPVPLSFPYIFKDNDEIYCLPEPMQKRETRIYKAVEFPHKWEDSSVLLPGFIAVDSTVFRHDDLWWLFCTDKETGPNTHLHIWYAEELHGEWKQHPLNPVKIDICTARPAGAPFYVDGVLYRPAQDSSQTYGGRLIIHRVKKLSTTEYSEEIAKIVNPVKGPYPHGIHTISSAGGRTLVDAKVLEFQWKQFFVRMLRGKNQSASNRKQPDRKGQTVD